MAKVTGSAPKSKKFDLDAYKKSIKVADTPLKKDKFVELDPCMHEILGMPGLPLGHITEIFGKSDTGKTSIMFHAAAQAQAQGILPILIITEGKVSWDRAAAMGLDSEGLVIIREDLQYLEEVYSFMGKVCADVGSGELPYDVMIFWDSLGNTLSQKEVEVHKDGTTERKSTMMVAGKCNSEGLRILSTQVNNTRKISHPKTVGITIINTCYTKPAAFPGGMPSEVPYGGEAAWYKASLILKTKRRKKLTATKDGVAMGFGIVSSISVEKNHITNTSHSGEYVITGNAIIPNENSAIEAYKEEHKESWGSLEIMDGETGELFAGSVVEQE
jgi:recombination protein RecA